MSSKNRGTRIGSLRYRSRESRKLIALLLFNLLILDEMFLYIFFSLFLLFRSLELSHRETLIFEY